MFSSECSNSSQTTLLSHSPQHPSLRECLLWIRPYSSFIAFGQLGVYPEFGTSSLIRLQTHSNSRRSHCVIG
ncbi:unnamed protein product [Paramecium octaurelia]|uniref:Uncharacterized protein n=1 Tax=Paramecium octaurelia TaxID=43137 RepID=A0A8S1UI05_PAROT|nr:unnamed protein product [Paramecium octaurelia]